MPQQIKQLVMDPGTQNPVCVEPHPPSFVPIGIQNGWSTYLSQKKNLAYTRFFAPPPSCEPIFTKYIIQFFKI